MPVTAPTVDGTPDYVDVSWRYIDANAQLGSHQITTTTALATPTAIQAVTDALGDMTNANVYAVVVSNVYASAGASPAAAVEAPRESVKDVINELWKDGTTKNTFDFEIPAPLDALFVEGTNDVDPANTLFTDLNTALNALLPVQWVPISLRFTERKKQNKRTRI